MLIGVVALVAVVVLDFFVGFIALGVFAALSVVGLLVLAVDRVLLALSPKRRERRANQTGMFVWRFGQFSEGQVVDTKVIDATATTDKPRSDRPGLDKLEPE